GGQRRSTGSPRRDRRRGGQARAATVVAQVEQREREVRRIGGEHLRRDRARLLRRLHDGGRRAQIAQHAQTALAQHALRRLGDRDEHAADAARLRADRAVAEREVALLDVVVAVEGEDLVLQEGGL